MADPLLEIADVSVVIPARRRLVPWGERPQPFRPLKGISLAVSQGGAFGLVGESGAGKTTLFKVITGLQKASSGIIRFDGEPLGIRRTTAQRRAMQMVFQDPYSSLNPRMTVGRAIGELLRVHRIVPHNEIPAELERLMGLVDLPPAALGKRPRRFSGGQRQRIAIARALALRPRLLLADEPVSALDVSVQAGILKLLKRLQTQLGLTVVFVSHDLAVVRQYCEQAAVMLRGEIVERGTTSQLFTQPQHPYTEQLVAAMSHIPPRSHTRAFAPKREASEIAAGR